jgi:hypothetical protein
MATRIHTKYPASEDLRCYLCIDALIPRFPELCREGTKLISLEAGDALDREAVAAWEINYTTGHRDSDGREIILSAGRCNTHADLDAFPLPEES